MIVVAADPKDLELVLSKLEGAKKQAPKAIRTALNDTAATARKLLAQHAQQRYTVKNAGFNRHAEIQKATLAKLEAAIRVQGAPLTQPRYHTTAPKSGVKTEVLKGEGLQELVNQARNKAFIQKVDGVNLVLQRVKKYKKATKRGESEEYRYPLHSAHGPSVSKMLEKVYQGGKITDEGLREDILEIYQANLKKQIERMMNK